jgi:hypothetical protein
MEFKFAGLRSISSAIRGYLRRGRHLPKSKLSMPKNVEIVQL